MIKKALLAAILALVLIPGTLQAQYYGNEPMTASRWKDYQRHSYFGLRFGLNVANVFYKGTGGMAQTEPLSRFHVGLVYGNKLGDGLPFFLESGLIYSEKGTRINGNEETGRRDCNLKYFEIPLVLKYRIDTNVDDLNVQPFFGGFMSVGIAGKTKYYDTREKSTSYGDTRYKHFDAGLRLGCGMAYQNFYFEMGYDIGLFNMAGSKYTDYHYDDFNGHIRTGNLTVSVGVNF